MDLLDELEAMAQAALVSQDDDDIPESAIARWQKPFGYSTAMAETKITEHRNDPLRFTVSEDHWTVLRDRMDAEGHDHESYEHSCIRTPRDAIYQRQEMTMKEKRRPRASTVLVKLEGPLHSVQPSFKQLVNHLQPRLKFLQLPIYLGWLRENPYPGFTPTFIRDLNAPKDLSSTSFHPTLGLDTTLPQYRLGSDEIPRPAQKEYPVWYFFYGTLADPSVLTKLLGSDFQAEYYAGKIRGGALKTWGRYIALVDDPSRTNLIHGKALLVQTREEEERLRAYETHLYEVVRCSIEMGSEEPANGLTFRFITDMMD
ncbi:hypothetical protein FOXYSP1_04623 [Fusarium oxysporum f. sp. phaseoli]